MQDRPGGRSERGDDSSRPDRGLGGQQVEGRQAIRELLIAGNRRVHEIWLAGDLDQDDAVDEIVALAEAARVPIVTVARSKVEARARSEAPQGVIAFAAEIADVEFDELLARPKPFLVALDGITDPGNLGAIIRSCNGAGVDGIVLPRHRAAHVTPTVAKASAGAVEYARMALVGGIPAALSAMKARDIWIVGLDETGERSLFDIGDLAAEPICLVMGAEGAGLSRLVRERCDMLVHIPMHGRVASLNVSAAAALATYEVTRQRR